MSLSSIFRALLWTCGLYKKCSLSENDLLMQYCPMHSGTWVFRWHTSDQSLFVTSVPLYHEHLYYSHLQCLRESWVGNFFSLKVRETSALQWVTGAGCEDLEKEKWQAPSSTPRIIRRSRFLCDRKLVFSQ